MKNFAITGLLVLSLSSCYYGINEKTSGISSINYSCPNSQWDSIVKDYSVDSIKDSSFAKMVNNFKRQTFASELIYFEKDPQEIIGISTDHYQIRYVYNPNLSSKVLDGFSKKLTDAEVDRISKRIYDLLEKYGCKENQ